MADALAGLGLSDDVVEAARAAGYESPTPLQAAAAKVLRRGGNVVLHASSGAGVTAAFGLPLIDRLASDDAGSAGVRALVLTSSAHRAERIAEGLGVLAGATGISVRAIGTGWRTGGADILITTPQRALEGVETSELKLDAVQALVVMDASELFASGAGSVLETLVQLVPRDAQRVVTTAELGGDVDRFVESHVRKALTVPARPAAPPRTPEAVAALGQIGYLMVDESSKSAVLARLLEGVEESAAVYVRTSRRAEQIRSELSRRGIAEGERDVRVSSFDEDAGAASRVISADVPFTADQLKRIHADGGTVLITPAERAHLRRIAGEVPFTLKHRKARQLDTGALDAFRATVREAIAAEDLDSQLLVLEPLFDEHDPAEVAAALSALLRRRPAATPVAAPGVAAATGAPPADATAGGFTRLFVSVGTRDNVRAGDIVGAITGEANIRGDQVGRVDIRDSFSVVEVASAVAERVIRALNGTTMRGRSLRVDYDRKATGGAAREGRQQRGPGGPRSGGDRPRAPRGDRPPGPPRRRPPAR